MGLVRGGIGRVDLDGLFAQEDDVLQLMTTDAGRTELRHLLEGTSE